MRRLELAAALTLVAAALLAGLPAAAAATAAPRRASFTDVENDVMCVVCHEPLAVAQSPEAFQERDYIRSLIAQGKTKREIEHDLVQQYGSAVLAKPPAHGFDVLVYVLPPVVVIAALVLVAITIPRWRRRSSPPRTDRPGPPTTALSAADARRLEDDLARDA